MKVSYKKPALKALLKLPPKVRIAIYAKVAAFAAGDQTVALDIDTLKGVENGFRLRQGGWRVLMYIADDTVFVADIKPRGDAYK